MAARARPYVERATHGSSPSPDTPETPAYSHTIAQISILTRRVENFSRDVSDGENYTVLLHQLSPSCSLSPLQERDLHARAEQVLRNADSLGCRKFLTPNSLVAGNPKLNLAFVANLFNNHPGLDPLEEVEVPQIDDFDAEGEREARVFTLWLNSLDVEPGVYNLFEDLKVGARLSVRDYKANPRRRRIKLGVCHEGQC